MASITNVILGSLPSNAYRPHLPSNSFQRIHGSHRPIVSSFSTSKGVFSLSSEAPVVNELIAYLESDLPKLFEKGEVDQSKFDPKINFEDPITKYDSLDGYLFNIKLLLLLFEPVFNLHSTKQTGPYEITTRWSMSMDFKILPWRPQIVFTGLSIYGINPSTGKFNSHIDVWDSISDQKYLSIEGLKDLLKQSSQFHTRLDKISPDYAVLLRREAYEIREYEPFVAVELSAVDSSSARLNFVRKYLSPLTRYAEGANSESKKLEKGLPVILESTSGTSSSAVLKLRVVLGLGESTSNFPTPLEGNPSLRVIKVPRRILAVSRFGGEVTDELFTSQEEELRVALERDNIRLTNVSNVAFYNFSSLFPSLNRNEVLLEVEDFSLDFIN